MADPDLSLLARRVSKGDVEAFTGIVQQTQGRLYRLAARLAGSTHDAEDVLQEAYVKAFNALTDGRFDGRSSVQTWLYRIVSNAAIDATRRRKARPVSDTDDYEPEADTSVDPDGRLALRELDEWLSELSVEQRTVLILRAVEGFSTAETADILGCSEGAVEQRLIRARANLSKRRGET
ncbi:MAG: RNA polymerase sigma factor [Polyangiaceae bacterium]